MTADIQNSRTETDDIDLLLLLERALLFFKRYTWLFFSALLVGLLFGGLVYRALPTVYESRMIVHSFLLTNQEEMQIIENWDDLLKKKEYTLLAEALHCKEDILYRLKKIKTEEIQKVYTPNNPNGFTVEVTVTDNAILPDLQTAIVYGLENSEYVKDRMALRKDNYQQLVDKTTIEIKKLDSTKKTLENIINGTEKTSSSLLIDGSSINRQLIEMEEKLLTYKENLQFSTAVQVLQSFSAFKKPVGPKLIVWLFLGVVLCLVVAYVVALLHSVKVKLQNRKSARIHS